MGLAVRGEGAWFTGDHGVVHYARTRTRTLYVCHVFLRNRSSGRMAGVWREGDDGKPGNGGPVLSEWSENYGTVHFRNKRGRKKRYLTFKKVRLTFWKVKLTFLKVSRTLKTGVFKALIVHFRNCFSCRGIHKGHGYLKEKTDKMKWMKYFKRKKSILWCISAAFKIYMVRHARPRKVKEGKSAGEGWSFTVKTKYINMLYCKVKGWRI